MQDLDTVKKDVTKPAVLEVSQPMGKEARM